MAARTQVIIDAAKSAAAPAEGVAAPPWALARGAHAKRAGATIADLRVELQDGGDFAMASARLADAVEMSADMLERRVTEVYAAIVARITPLGANRPVRIWNHIPSIHEQMDAERD